MKRVKREIIALICLLAVSIVSFSACTITPLHNVGKLSYIEWRDDEGVFHLRAAKDGAYGCGTIVLNGEEIPAGFNVGANKPSFVVYISLEAAEKLGYDLSYNYNGVAFDGFVPNYSKKKKVITSRESDVELFGVKIGKVRLKAYPVDKSEFAIWEIRSTWSDGDNKLRIDNVESNYFLYKCLRAEATPANGKTKYLTFRWLDDSTGFRIYDKIEEEDYKNIAGETPYLAEGTFELDGNNIILQFTKDEVLGLQGKSLYLTEWA